MPRRTIAGMRQALADTPNLSDTQKQQLRRYIDEKEAADFNLGTRMLVERTWRDAEEASDLEREYADGIAAAELLVQRGDAGQLSYEDALGVYEDLRQTQREASARHMSLVTRHVRAHEELQDPVALMDRMRSKWGELHYSPI